MSLPAPDNVRDARGVPLKLDRAPVRIASLYPSGTETLYALGAASRIVARTSWCPKPGGGSAAPAIGGTKNPDIAQLRALRPDLVVACRDENRREDVEAIEAFAPVFVTDPRTVADVPTMIRDLAVAARADRAAADVLARRIEELALRPAPSPRRRGIVLIWRDPWWTVGGGTYVTDLLRVLGIDNAFSSVPRPYFTVDAAALADAAPDVLLLPDEPYRFQPSDLEALTASEPRLRSCAARFFDGSLLSWHGVRSVRGLEELPALLQ